MTNNKLEYRTLKFRRIALWIGLAALVFVILNIIAFGTAKAAEVDLCYSHKSWRGDTKIKYQCSGLEVVTNSWGTPVLHEVTVSDRYRWRFVTDDRFDRVVTAPDKRGPAMKFTVHDATVFNGLVDELSCGCGEEDAPAHKHKEVQKPKLPVPTDEDFTNCYTKDDYENPAVRSSDTNLPFYLCFYNANGRPVAPYDCTLQFQDEIDCQFEYAVKSHRFMPSDDNADLAEVVILGWYKYYGWSYNGMDWIDILFQTKAITNDDLQFLRAYRGEALLKAIKERVQRQLRDLETWEPDSR